MQGGNFTLPDRERVPDAFTALVLYFFACLGRLISGDISAVICRVFSYFMYGVTENFAENLTGIVYYTIFIVVPLTAVMGRKPGIHEYTRIHPLSGKLSFFCVVAGGLGAMFITWFSYLWIIPIQELGGILPDSGVKIPSTAGGMMMTIITSAVLPGVCEELLFRGAILSACEERGSKKAMLITAFMFMCVHGSVVGMVSEFISGLVLAFIVISTDSVFAGIIYHSVHNSLLLLLSYKSGQAETDASARIWEAIGGAGGLVQIVILSVVFGAALLLVLKCIDNARRDRNFGVEKSAVRDVSWQELLVMGSCAAIVLLFYACDLLAVMGVTA